jgi:outer membrane protein OmpU
MKKIMLGTTALVGVAAMASGVQAADPLKLSLGGFAEYYMVARSQRALNDDGNGNSQKGRGFSMYWEDAEIWFSASTQLDNGITVGYRMELETRNRDASGIDGNNVINNSSTDRNHFRDDHRITFTGGFGQFQLGDTAGAADVMQYQAPGVTKIGVVDGTDLLINPSNNAAYVGTLTGAFNTNNRINYFTPRFAPGFQFGVSFAPEAGTTGRGNGGADGNAGPVQTEEDNGDFESITELGVNFVRSMNGVDVAWSLTGVYAPLEECVVTSVPGTGYLGCDAKFADTDRYIAQSGFQVSFAGWTVGAGASIDNRGREAGDGMQWEANAGVTYGIGPWAFGLQGGYAEANNNFYKNNGETVITDTVTGPNAYKGGTDTKAAIGLGASYTLGPGILLQAEAQYINWGNKDFQDGDNGVSAGTYDKLSSHKESSGFAFAFGTALSF